MGSYVHHSFKSVSSKNDKQVFDINDVIRALEETVEADVKLVRKFASSLKKSSDKDSYLSNTAFVVRDTAEMAKVGNALIAARSMKENGIDSLLLDPRYKMWTQVLEQTNEETCPDLFHKGADSFTILKFSKK